MAEKELFLKDLQVVVCEIESELYGIPISKVSEIITISQITSIPGAKPEMKGLVNLRGVIIPVFHLGMCLSISDGKAFSSGLIVIINAEHEKVGFIVDNVREVAMFHASELEQTPNFFGEKKDDYVWCIAKQNEELVTLIDLERVLAA